MVACGGQALTGLPLTPTSCGSDSLRVGLTVTHCEYESTAQWRGHSMVGLEEIVTSLHGSAHTDGEDAWPGTGGSFGPTALREPRPWTPAPEAPNLPARTQWAWNRVPPLATSVVTVARGCSFDRGRRAWDQLSRTQIPDLQKPWEHDGVLFRATNFGGHF